jgi:hypothetical protein
MQAREADKQVIVAIRDENVGNDGEPFNDDQNLSCSSLDR